MHTSPTECREQKRAPTRPAASRLLQAHPQDSRAAFSPAYVSESHPQQSARRSDPQRQSKFCNPCRIRVRRPSGYNCRRIQTRDGQARHRHSANPARQAGRIQFLPSPPMLSSIPCLHRRFPHPPGRLWRHTPQIQRSLPQKRAFSPGCPAYRPFLSAHPKRPTQEEFPRESPAPATHRPLPPEEPFPAARRSLLLKEELSPAARRLPQLMEPLPAAHRHLSPPWAWELLPPRPFVPLSPVRIDRSWPASSPMPEETPQLFALFSSETPPCFDS